jgi:hypothetical protein
MLSLCRWRNLAPGALLLSLVLAGSTRADDVLDREKARREVEAQRIEKLVKDAEQEASRLGRANRLADAAAVLQSALDEVEKSTSLPEERRARLKSVLNGDIRAFGPSTAAPPVRTTPIQPTRPVVDSGRGPTDKASDVIASRGSALKEGQTAKNDRGQGIQVATGDVYKSAVVVAEDYKLPADWIEKSKRRSKVQMTDRERAILRELNTTRSVEFKGETFQEVINYLSKATGQTIVVPKNILEEAGVTYETPIKLDLKNVSTRSILKKMLADLNLTYIIKDEAIQITTPERARQTLTTRTYYIGDLLAVVQDYRFPAVYNQAAAIQQINSLASMIINSYDPDSWQGRGGPGSITFNPGTMTFVVTQTAEMHFLMGVGMR